jgi:hypothetical protein
MLSTSQSAAGPAQPLGQAALEQLLGPPQVGGLPGEGGAVHARQRREVGPVVLAEVPEQPRVAVEPQVLADQLDGDDLAVGQLGAGAALAGRARAEGLQMVIHEAEHHKQEVLQRHGGPPDGRSDCHSSWQGPPRLTPATTARQKLAQRDR